jgi:RNA polymerase sigma-70 factor (ECF subfamily)
LNTSIEKREAQYFAVNHLYKWVVKVSSGGKMNRERERELVMKARDGDEYAYQQLVETHVRRVYSLALKYTGRHQDADDVAQDAFIRAYKSLDSFKGDSAFGTWVYRIAVNCCLTLKRKQSKWGESLDEEFASHIEDKSALDNERITQSRQTKELVSEAMQKLSPQQRAIFVMKYLQQKTIREIASVLDCAEGTVKQQLFRAVRKMRNQLSPLMEQNEVAS